MNMVQNRFTANCQVKSSRAAGIVVLGLLCASCAGIGLKRSEPVATVKELVNTVGTAISLTCGNLDDRNRALPADQEWRRIDMQSAVLTLSTAETRAFEGEVSLLVASGKGSRKTSSGDVLEVKLGRAPIPNESIEKAKPYAPNAARGAVYATLPMNACGEKTQTPAEHIGCLVLAALDGTKGLQPELVLNGFAVSLDFTVETSSTGGLKFEFNDLGVGGSATRGGKNAHQIKMEFGPAPKQKAADSATASKGE